jgi:iron(III) transport system permease protein
MRRFRDFILYLLILAIFAALFAVPIYSVINVAFFGTPDAQGQQHPFTLAYFHAVFADPTLREGLINSGILAVGTTLLCTLIAVPLAVLSVRYDFVGKSLFGGLLLVPLILPPFVGAIGMRQLLGRFGAFTAIAQHLGIVAPGHPIDWLHFRMLGIILVEALSLYPIIYLNVTAALSNIDPAMQQAAANLGAGRWTIFRRITLPLLSPGLFAGATIVLIWSFTELGTPLMFDYYSVTPVQVFQRIGQVTDSPLPYAMVVLMLVGSVGLYIGGKLILGRGIGATAVTKAGTQSAGVRLGIIRSIPVMLPFAIVSGLALLPHIAVILISISGVGSWYETALPTVFTAANFVNGLTHPLAVPSVQNSIFYASFSTVADIALGLLIAVIIVRSSLPRALRGLLDGIAMLPLAVPGLVMAFGYLAVAIQLRLLLIRGGHPMLASIFDVQNSPTLMLILAYAMRRLPYVVRSAVAGLQQTPPDLELAAKNLGAGGWLTLRRITIPLISANLIAGGLLAFAFAMLEVSDSLILAQRDTHWPITKAIYELYSRLGDGPYIAAALGVWAMLILTLTILAASGLLGRRMGAIFRV